MRSPTILTLLALAAAPVAWAQDAAPQPTLIDRIRAASRIPTRTAEAREAGVPDSSVRSVLDVFRRRNTDPVEAEAILTTERDAAREHGPTDNFGAFVQTQLESGKRGQELAAAIRAEHQAHGKGRGGHEGGRPEGDAAKEHGKPADAGAPGTPATGGKGKQGGRPDSADHQKSSPSQGQGQQGQGRRPH